jgi:flagellar motor switch protein FliM
VFDIEGSGQQGVIDLSGDFAFFLVDRLFGGSGDPVIMSRALTPIERMAVRTVAERAIYQLVESWADYVELNCSITGFESIPEILRAANPEDPVLVANIEVTCAQSRSMLVVCLPFVVLEKFFAGDSERRVTAVGTARDQAASREITERSLRSTRVPIAARLPAFRLTLQQLAALKAGSVLTTGVPRDSSLEVYVGTQLRFHAAPGRVGASLALRLLDRIMPTDGSKNAQPT